ncbi:bifunctional tRNA (5-methylaminomethyl-2-thiouridine)(34)-methyltransferase MnmD/FAD-dependent 5-carboxymethylaminomethyl-2-thiouridine(34) oxidoreductase MnmC [Campylobacter sp. MIT 21-1685]|uniref:bifunctional tRNA (5-methylaminomethyl-2-thiouridine)(34)-methyltransferase MnmD/FAD-dependent 5-carboxymethylaminomethyl-2-thiouridine(34) oxidoreductase MnmC n=1 Tax=unclassified Campylobacter TaxID=2593542 RepID=UPI00224B1723|nr:MULTISPECIES: bifunctional tRNA (5-methylaminomethyl-2-thiouridine)(34)-methyltransferase MnmD/FAD-dependent 5-carboxymethylaminomethyl-2-thiouridine(34) oxidoreductase MnmC [unclassified Campylobacter]MCX2682469.1 bifunctional tRNA (5-methylaminomethyl-2-thiouridine)(34)-methyltransferase MnmD/FAD-dependent 5-carboxymethylaminomethyl-2-thiouridine(34) oxidoreductase MnmC [Campylobacter sp. MIT 21-1684]MCX2750818.1 bifunctional tRNA (5-methylaminomethyl-2-thiouridine)(34)-methyltransferase Mnm
MKKANLIVRNNTPFSLDFDDYYFNSNDGLNESKFVYTESFAWDKKDEFVIAESGFGIGLNFFLTLKRFLHSKDAPKHLFYISIEAFYIEKEKLRELYKQLGFYGEFKEYIEQFLQFYPKCKEGYYRFYFENCFLDLVFADISVLKRLEFKADIWYLDGFSPNKNPQMFDTNCILELSRLCRKNAQICTFSSSSTLQKTLCNFGFEIQKLRGFRKREMIRAFFRGEEIVEEKERYFSKVQCALPQNKHIAIIGAGICAATLAYELSLRGFKISVFEKNTDLSQGNSGNESGILSSLILKPEVALGEFSQNAFIEASRFYSQILGLKLSGVMEIAHTKAMQERFIAQSTNALFQIHDKKAFLEDGGHIFPKELVSALFEKSKANLYYNHEFQHYAYEDENFTLYFKNNIVKTGFGILIYAMGADTKDFIHYDAMKLSKIRGQLSYLKPFLKTAYALSSKAYICPIKNDLQVIGASFDRFNTSREISEQENRQNIINIAEFLKGNEKLEIKGAKVGFRSYASDRFPIIGPAYDENFYKKEYKDLLWTKKKIQVFPQNISHLYLNFAHGSRAFSTSILAARYLCALINDEPLGFFRDFIPYIHPARFLIRKLKKGL